MEFYQKNPEAMQQITAPLYEEKVVDFIIELAKVTDKNVTVDEMMKAFEEDDKTAAKKTKKKPAKKAASKKQAAADTDDKPAAKKKKASEKKAD